jgi:nucleotide sugar dehydrogenase
MNKLMDKISIIGVGKLGLCLGLNLERKGFNITGVDINENYIQSLNNKTYTTSEPFVNEYLQESKNVKFTTDLKQALENDVLFVVVRTPSTSDWKYDHTDIENIADKLISFGKQNTRKDLIINCTTFPGYCDTLQEKLKDYNYFVSYNPEFIAQGTIIKDQIKCDNVLIGEADKYAGDLINVIYYRMVESNPIYNRMSRTEAELTKLSVNCFLTTKISYANMIGDIASRLGCDADRVLKAIGTDSRIGNKYLKPGFGFGGPCFPRDNRAFGIFAEMMGVYPHISYATDQSNTDHVSHYSKTLAVEEKVTIIFESVAYKPGTTIIEESQQLKTALYLVNQGYRVVIRETSRVIEQVKNLHGYKFVYEERN